MSDESVLAPVLSHETIQVPDRPAEELPPPAISLPAPTAEQVQASDRAFSREEHLVAGLIGMHLGILVLRDIAAETTAPAEEEKRPRRKPNEEDER
jgi:hypothetical protein